MELKPCPFCGEIPEIFHYKTFGACIGSVELRHFCKDAKGFCVGLGGSNRDALIMVWNARCENGMADGNN